MTISTQTLSSLLRCDDVSNVVINYHTTTNKMVDSRRLGRLQEHKFKDMVVLSAISSSNIVLNQNDLNTILTYYRQQLDLSEKIADSEAAMDEILGGE